MKGKESDVEHENGRNDKKSNQKKEDELFEDDE